MKKRDELKDVFNGLSSLLFTTNDYDLDGSGVSSGAATYPALSETVDYKPGDIVTYQSKVYTCTTAHKGAWVASHFTEGIVISFDYELPVTVDTLQVSQDDPTINHYKVIGLQGDWTSSAESGEFNVQFTVPTKHTDVIKLAFGDDAAVALAGIKLPDLGAGTWEGTAVTVNMHKVTGTIGLLDEAKENLMIIRNIALYAKPLYENPSSEPFAIQFSGSIETSGDANFAWLKKQK